MDTEGFSMKANLEEASLFRLLLIAGAIVLIVATGAAGRAAASGFAADRVVYPTGAYPTDVQNVQAAVDQGGTVLLKATNAAGVPTSFNFGPSQIGSRRVTLSGAVALLGESARGSTTTVSGGYVPLLSLPGASVTVDGIHFDRPFFEAIRLFDPARAVVTHNQIEHVVGRPLSDGVTLAFGIESILGGTIKIDDNVIENIDAEEGEGVGQFGADGSVEIARNQISGVNLNAIDSGPAGAGLVRIVDNVLLPGPERARFGFGQAIEVNGAGSYTISGNTAVCVNGRAFCIFVFGTRGFFGFGPVVAPVIEHNHITTQSEAVGIVMAGQILSPYVGQNRIDGHGYIGLATDAIGLGAGDEFASPTFVGNNFTGFTGSFADVFLDQPTHDAVLVGFGGNVVDLGTNDRITGLTRMGGQHIGTQISQANALRNQMLRDAQADLDP